MRTAFLFAFAFASCAFTMQPRPAHADCWPPFNAREERRIVRVPVGGVSFATGFYRYEVPMYRVESSGCDESISRGPESWHWEFGPDSEDIVPSANAPQSGARVALPPLPALPPLGALPSLPSPPPIPALQPLPPVRPLPSLPSLPASR